MVRRDIKFARSLSIATKLKFPFPHMVAVVVKERSGGGLQLLTQGTADIILDSCIEYWDGHDLCPFSALDRYYIVIRSSDIFVRISAKRFLKCLANYTCNAWPNILETSCIRPNALTIFLFGVAERKCKTFIRERAWPRTAPRSLIGH